MTTGRINQVTTKTARIAGRPRAAGSVTGVMKSRRRQLEEFVHERPHLIRTSFGSLERRPRSGGTSSATLRGAESRRELPRASKTAEAGSQLNRKTFDQRPSIPQRCHRTDYLTAVHTPLPQCKQSGIYFEQ